MKLHPDSSWRADVKDVKPHLYDVTPDSFSDGEVLEMSLGHGKFWGGRTDPENAQLQQFPFCEASSSSCAMPNTLSDHSAAVKLQAAVRGILFRRSHMHTTIEMWLSFARKARAKENDHEWLKGDPSIGW